MDNSSSQATWMKEVVNIIYENLPLTEREQLDQCDRIPSGGAGEEPNDFATSRKNMWGTDSLFKFLKTIRCNRDNKVIPYEDMPEQIHPDPHPVIQGFPTSNNTTEIQSFKTNTMRNARPPEAPQKTADDVLNIVLENTKISNADVLQTLSVVDKRTNKMVDVVMDEHLRNVIIQAKNDNQKHTMAERFVTYLFLNRVGVMIEHIRNTLQWNEFAVILEEPIHHCHVIVKYDKNFHNPYEEETLDTIKFVLFFPTGEDTITVQVNGIEEIERVKRYNVCFSGNEYGICEYVTGNTNMNIFNIDSHHLYYVKSSLYDYKKWTFPDLLNAVMTKCKMTVHLFRASKNNFPLMLKCYAVNKALPKIFKSPVSHKAFIEKLDRLEIEVQNGILPSVIPESSDVSDEHVALNFGTQYPHLEAQRNNPIPLIYTALGKLILDIPKRLDIQSTRISMKYWNAVDLQLTKCPPDDRPKYMNYLKGFLGYPKGVLISKRVFTLTYDAFFRHEELMKHQVGRERLPVNDPVIRCNRNSKALVVYLRDREQNNRVLVSYLFAKTKNPSKPWKFITALPSNFNPMIDEKDASTTIIRSRDNKQNNIIITDDSMDEQYGIRVSYNGSFLTGNNDYQLNQTILMSILESTRVVQAKMTPATGKDAYVIFKTDPTMAKYVPFFYNEVSIPGWEEFKDSPGKTFEEIFKDRIFSNPFDKNNEQQQGGVRKKNTPKQCAKQSCAKKL